MYLYSAFIVATTLKALRRGSHSFTCKQHHACLSFVCIHQMSPPQQLRQQTSNCSSLLIYRPRKDERLSWPSWLTCSGWLTHISGHPSATGRAQDSERTPAKDQCSTAGLRNQPTCNQSSERQPNFAALNRGRHLCSTGRPSGWALTHILVVLGLVSSVLCQEIGWEECL